MNAGVRSGKPCIKNTRITVYDILKYFAGGMNESEILSDFPSLTHEDIKTVFAFSALKERITVDPKVMGGKLCIRGVRIAVDTITGLLSTGKTHDEILELYPDLEKEDIFAALAYHYGK